MQDAFVGPQARAKQQLGERAGVGVRDEHALCALDHLAQRLERVPRDAGARIVARGSGTTLVPDGKPLPECQRAELGLVQEDEVVQVIGLKRVGIAVHDVVVLDGLVQPVRALDAAHDTRVP